ncbi:hypothetical protein PU630_01030 [Microbacterium horticulturae]|uniref:FAD-binding FR-type domain-containing protein n=1 Tax=Microbacterium horticulturae TaxID=3028316 RepID=A0ABY8BY98_9MICO|nr:hypothetical protein [Microbacterium sp. KACC 23027]WEG09176.1 hypothetical protein PU630_01030 [Microbacterium sp. KACC 23027]
MKGRLWLTAEVSSRSSLGENITQLELRVPDWPGHLPGQYVEVRPDAGSDVRRFSIANPHTAGSSRIHLVAVSDVLRGLAVGSFIEVCGPEGEGLRWDADATASRPLLLIAGGTGVVPLIAIAREWRRRAERSRLTLLYSVRSAGDVVYGSELEELDAEDDGTAVTVITRRGAEGSRVARPRRLSALDLELYGIAPSENPECFVCGPPSFVEDVARMLVQAKHAAVRIHTEWDVFVGGGT